MRVVAQTQGPLAHCVFFPVGFECSLAVSLGGERIKMGSHLQAEGNSGGCGSLGLPPTLLQLHSEDENRHRRGSHGEVH